MELFNFIKDKFKVFLLKLIINKIFVFVIL